MRPFRLLSRLRQTWHPPTRTSPISLGTPPKSALPGRFAPIPIGRIGCSCLLDESRSGHLFGHRRWSPTPERDGNPSDPGNPDNPTNQGRCARESLPTAQVESRLIRADSTWPTATNSGLNPRLPKLGASTYCLHARWTEAVRGRRVGCRPPPARCSWRRSAPATRIRWSSRSRRSRSCRTP